MTAGVSVDVRIPRPGKLTEAVKRMIPLANAAAVLGAEIRRRVRGRGETSRGGKFLKHTKPLRFAGTHQWIPRRWLTEAPAQASDASMRRRARWLGGVVIAEDPQRDRVLVRVPRPTYKSGETQRFDFTGESWDHLKVHLTAKGRVRVGFAGKSEPGFGGPVVRNALKMAMQNAPHDDHILAPSEPEVQGLVDGLSAGMDDELRAVFNDAHSPAPRSRGNQRVMMQVRSRAKPLPDGAL